MSTCTPNRSTSGKVLIPVSCPPRRISHRVLTGLMGLVFFSWFSACRTESVPNDTTDASAAEQVVTNPSPETDLPSFSVNVAGLRLRAEHGPDADVIRVLEQGETLYDLQTVSDYTTPIRLRGIEFNEPWIKVRTMRGEEGWVYGGALHAELNGSMSTAFLLMEKRLTTLFGEELQMQVSTYRDSFTQIQTADEFAQVYEQGIRLRNALTTPLERAIEVGNTNALPDLFWLAQVMPGFQPTLVAEGTSYYLFADYGDWLDKAAGTPGTMDDDFVDLAIQFYQGDSVEYFYPAFFLQTWDYGGHSLLGRGIHLELLLGIEALQARYPGQFAETTRTFLQQLIDDMTAAHVTYWEPAEVIVEELGQIAEKEWSVLSREHIIAIKTRLRQFREPEKYNLQTNLKSGLTQ